MINQITKFVETKLSGQQQMPIQDILKQNTKEFLSLLGAKNISEEAFNQILSQAFKDINKAQHPSFMKRFVKDIPQLIITVIAVVVIVYCMNLMISPTMAAQCSWSNTAVCDSSGFTVQAPKPQQPITQPSGQGPDFKGFCNGCLRVKDKKYW